MLKNPQEGQEIWIIKFDGPRAAKFIKMWTAHNKVLVETAGGMPELIDYSECYTAKHECFSVVIEKLHAKSIEMLKQASRHSMELSGGEEDNKK